MSLFHSNKSKQLEFILNESGPKAYPPDKASDVSAKAWQQARDRGSRTMIIYIHGRAHGGLAVIGPGWDQEPNESFTSPPIIDEFEKAHNATVLMIHWPHFDKFATDFPKEYAERASPLLLDIVPNIMQQRRPDLNVPVVIVTHSMGGIVLETAVKKAGGTPFAGVSKIVTSASAAELIGSSDWLNKLGGNVFITRNEHDNVLKIAPEGRLGRGAVDALAQAGCANNAFYLDVSPLGVNHQYFVVGGANNNNQNLKRLQEQFYGPLYQGKSPNPAHFKHVTSGQPIYQLV